MAVLELKSTSHFLIPSMSFYDFFTALGQLTPHIMPSTLKFVVVSIANANPKKLINKRMFFFMGSFSFHAYGLILLYLTYKWMI